MLSALPGQKATIWLISRCVAGWADGEANRRHSMKWPEIFPKRSPRSSRLCKLSPMSSDRPTRATNGGRAYLDLQSLARTTGRSTDDLMRLYALEGPVSYTHLTLP